MSLEHFREATELAAKYSFQSLLMAAMKTAPSEELRQLNGLYPNTLKELVDRLNAKDGILESDQVVRPRSD